MARKGENIYKRKDGRWEGRYIKSRSSTGKANYGYVYAKSYREVKAKLISQSSCTSNSVTVDPEISSDQFEQVAMEWFQAICPKVKESTSNKYRNLLSSYILPVFGSKQLRDITHEFIETQCNFFLVSGGLKENGLSSKTVSDILSLIRNVLQFATRNGKAISCDARSIQIKRQTKEMRVLSRAEQEKLCQYLYSNLDSCNIGILVCLFTGLRVGEICALRWEDVSFSDYTIHVHQTLQRIQDRTNSEYKTRIVVTTPKSACSIRTIPVPHGLMTIDATTNGQLHGNYGHSRNYWTRPGNLQAEAFAHFFEASMGDQGKLELLANFFPTAFGIFSSMIDSIRPDNHVRVLSRER